MKKALAWLQSSRVSWLRSSRGATAVEYGLIVGAIAVAVMGIIFTMGDYLHAIFTKISGYLGR